MTQPIKLFLRPEIFPPQNSTTFKLAHVTDGIKENINIWRVRYNLQGEIMTEQIVDIIPAGKVLVKLSGIPLLDRTIDIPGSYIVNFIDGFTEFEDTTEFAFSVDNEKGYVFLRNPYDVDVSITYWRNMEFKLSNNDFTLAEDMQTVSVSRWVFDPISSYKFIYNISFPIDKSYYKILEDGRTLQLLPKTIIDQYLGATNLSEQFIKITYRHKHQDNDAIRSLYQYISPLISSINVFYGTGE